MPWTRKGPNRKMQQIANAGHPSKPLSNALHEAILQDIIKNQNVKVVDLSKKFNSPISSIYNIMNRTDFDDRKNYLQQQAANKAVNIRSYVLKELLEANEAQKKQRPGALQSRLLELLGKTEGMYLEKIEHKGLPKRIVIRTEKAITELAAEDNEPDATTTN